MSDIENKGFLDRVLSDDAQADLPFYKRREFLTTLLVVVIAAALYLPGLGSYPLWDPWEPHYSQVAMEMNQTDTWLVPTYRNSNRWFSKPIILFWFLKPSFMLFGQTEFAARLPVVLLGLFGLAMVNILFGRLLHWKAGLLGALVLMTSPQWFFILRQTIFDGPYVVFQTTAFAFLLLGLFKYPDRPRYMYGFWVFSALSMLSKGLLAIVLPASAVGVFVLASWDWHLLKRMRFGKGLLIFFAIAAPWFVFMTAKFGYSYFHSFFIYHHFERAAGLIKKPNDTFELYVAQIFYATFPWCAFLPMALVRFLKFNSEDVLGKTRKHLLLFLCFAMPYIFFTLSSTKFNHYIFPVIPFLAVMIGYYLYKLMEQPPKPFARVELILALFIFIVIAKDLVTNYKYLIDLFIYYYDRPLPRSVNPRHLFYAAMVPMGVMIGVPFLFKRYTKHFFVGLFLATAAFSLILNNWVMPRLTDTMSQKVLWEAYEKLATSNEPICEYHSWERRSVSYYANNKTTYLNSRRANTTKRFFSQPGKLFCMVDRSKYSKLRGLVKKENNRDLHIVFSDHPFTYLVATEPPGSAAAEVEEEIILDKAPPVPNRLEAEFGDKIKLLGWKLNKDTFRIGERIELTLYLEALQDVDTDYEIFIHGDVYGGGGRMIGDHVPAEGKHPTDRWKKGQIIVDRWSGVIPETVSSGRMDISMGFFRGKHRLNVSNGVDDGEDRVKLTGVRVQN